MRDVDDLKEKVKAKLKPARYRHTLGVLKFAVKLAEIYHIDKTKAEVAALLHDYCKYETDECILDVLTTHSNNVHPVIKNQPNLGHGQMAAIVAKETFGIVDQDILNAILNHTFGDTGMSDLEKIIYLADNLEDNRQYDGIEVFREMALIDLNKTIVMVSENTIKYELQRGHMIHENTVIMRNEIMNTLSQ